MGDRLNKTLCIKSLRRANENGIRYKIKRIHILGEDENLAFSQSEKNLKITMGRKTENTIPVCICVEVE